MKQIFCWTWNFLFGVNFTLDFYELITLLKITSSKVIKLIKNMVVDYFVKSLWLKNWNFWRSDFWQSDPLSIFFARIRNQQQHLKSEKCVTHFFSFTNCNRRAHKNGKGSERRKSERRKSKIDHFSTFRPPLTKTIIIDNL